MTHAGRGGPDTVRRRSIVVGRYEPPVRVELLRAEERHTVRSRNDDTPFDQRRGAKISCASDVEEELARSAERILVRYVDARGVGPVRRKWLIRSTEFLRRGALQIPLDIAEFLGWHQHDRSLLAVSGSARGRPGLSERLRVEESVGQ